MPSSGIRWTRRDTRRLTELVRNTPEKADQFVRALAEQINGDIVLSFGTSPSPEGGPPGVDTGALRASMSVSKVEDRVYWVHDGVEYGVMLEYGTERMGARPFVGPAFEEYRQGGTLRQFAMDFGIFS